MKCRHCQNKMIQRGFDGFRFECINKSCNTRQANKKLLDIFNMKKLKEFFKRINPFKKKGKED